MTLFFILSQISVVISYIFQAITYGVKKRNIILILSFLSLIAMGLSYFFLNAYTGFAMTGVAILRNIIFMIQNKYSKNKDSEKLVLEDFIVLGILAIATAVAAYLACRFGTYNGFWSLFSVFATFLFTVSIWQKNVVLYNALGIIVSSLWIVYDIFVGSPFGIACESVLLVVTIIFLISKFIKKKKLKNTNCTESLGEQTKDEVENQ